MSNKNNNFSIEELSEEVEKLLKKNGLINNQSDRRINAIPDPRTIRYYTTLGLLEPPETINRQAKYNSNHVIQLAVIKALQAESLTLAEIQSRTYGKRIDELEQILIAISQKSKVYQDVSPVLWYELSIEPGLKIMVDELWLNNNVTDELIEKVKSALNTLTEKYKKRRN